MNLSEYLSYISGYIKATKIKKDAMDYPYILVLGNLLICLDGLKANLFIIELEYVSTFNIATTTDVISAIVDGTLDENLCFNYHIYNIVMSIYTRLLPYINSDNYRRISTNQDIPEFKATDNAIHGIYFYDDNPSEEFICYNYYNMVPISKSDSYYIDTLHDDLDNTDIIRYTVFKKKPKCTIVIYRRALNLSGV